MKQIPRSEIYSILSRLQGKCGLYIEHLRTGEIMEVNSHWICPSASVIKVPMLAMLLKEVQEGKFEWEEQQTVAEENRVGGSGILYFLDRYYAPTLKTAAKLMIQLSDNMCTNHIMDLLGIERFNRYWAEMGYPSFKLGRKMMDWGEIEKGKNNFLNAWDIGRLLSTIGRGELYSKEISDQIITIMRGQFYRTMLASLIPSVPGYAPPEDYERVQENMVLVASKSGGIPGVAHDVGIFDLPDGSRYIIACLTAELPNDIDGHTCVAQISKACYEAFK